MLRFPIILVNKRSRDLPTFNIYIDWIWRSFSNLIPMPTVFEPVRPVVLIPIAHTHQVYVYYTAWPVVLFYCLYSYFTFVLICMVGIYYVHPHSPSLSLLLSLWTQKMEEGNKTLDFKQCCKEQCKCGMTQSYFGESGRT